MRAKPRAINISYPAKPFNRKPEKVQKKELGPYHSRRFLYNKKEGKLIFFRFSLSSRTFVGTQQDNEQKKSATELWKRDIPGTLNSVDLAPDDHHVALGFDNGLDEIEKGFSGLQSSGSGDSGVTSRVFATFLTWMQEKVKPVFVIATANDIESLPPELLRKGRFDEIFFIDLPTVVERKMIFEIHFGLKKRDPKKYDVARLAKEADPFSGAEIEQAILSAMYKAFAENREFTTEDVLISIRETVPLAVTAKEKIAYLRQWAHQRARPSS